jgi:hypothetical protein
MYEIHLNFKVNNDDSVSFMYLPFIPKIGEEITFLHDDVYHKIKIVALNIIIENRTFSHIEIN